MAGWTGTGKDGINWKGWIEADEFRGKLNNSFINWLADVNLGSFGLTTGSIYAFDLTSSTLYFPEGGNITGMGGQIDITSSGASTVYINGGGLRITDGFLSFISNNFIFSDYDTGDFIFYSDLGKYYFSSGTGSVYFEDGYVHPDGYKSSDGSSGKTVTINYLKSPSGSGTLTFKNGILTAST
jgi:hypothetical protein